MFVSSRVDEIGACLIAEMLAGARRPGKFEGNILDVVTQADVLNVGDGGVSPSLKDKPT